MKLLILYFLLVILLSASMTLMGFGFLAYVKYQKQVQVDRLILMNKAETMCGTKLENFMIYPDGRVGTGCGDVLKDSNDSR